MPTINGVRCASGNAKKGAASINFTVPPTPANGRGGATGAIGGGGSPAGAAGLSDGCAGAISFAAAEASGTARRFSGFGFFALQDQRGVNFGGAATVAVVDVAGVPLRVKLPSRIEGLPVRQGDRVELGWRAEDCRLVVA